MTCGNTFSDCHIELFMLKDIALSTFNWNAFLLDDIIPNFKDHLVSSRWITHHHALRRGKSNICDIYFSKRFFLLLIVIYSTCIFCICILNFQQVALRSNIWKKNQWITSVNCRASKKNSVSKLCFSKLLMNHYLVE